MDINQKQKERLEQQFAFIREIDKEKFIGRQTYLTDGERKENDAEHAWHMAITWFIARASVLICSSLFSICCKNPESTRSSI